jgi:hypothetical protein
MTVPVAVRAAFTSPVSPVRVKISARRRLHYLTQPNVSGQQDNYSPYCY